MATRITMMARWKPLRWWQVSFSLFQFLSLTHKSPPVLVLLLKHTHAPDKSSSLSMPKHNHKQMHTHGLTHKFEINSNWAAVLKSQRTHCTFISNLCCAGSRRCVKPITGCCAFDKAWQQLEHVALTSEGGQTKVESGKFTYCILKFCLSWPTMRQHQTFLNEKTEDLGGFPLALKSNKSQCTSTAYNGRSLSSPWITLNWKEEGYFHTCPK